MIVQNEDTFKWTMIVIELLFDLCAVSHKWKLDWRLAKLNKLTLFLHHKTGTIFMGLALCLEDKTSMVVTLAVV